MNDPATPFIIELSSDSENDVECINCPENHAESSKISDNVFTLDWDDNYAPEHCNLLAINDEAVIGINSNPSPIQAASHTPENYDLECEVEEHITLPESLRLFNSKKLPREEKLAKAKIDKLKKEQIKLEKKRLQEEKKAELQKQKKLKIALAEKHKALKPEENIKLLIVNIDTNIVNSEYGTTIVSSLQQSGIHYVVSNLAKPFTVCWSKKIMDVIVNDDGITNENIGIKEEHQLIYIINSKEFVNLIYANELLTHIQTVASVNPDKSIMVVITGMKKYFIALKNNRNKEHAFNSKKGKHNTNNEMDHIVSMDAIEAALIEIQLLIKCNHMLIDTPDELSSLIIKTTKSLSQLDYKLEKYQKEEELDWFAKGDSKHCIKVDKNGNGLMRLWQQQICQFSWIGMDAALAITSNFRSPSELLNCYEKCKDQKEAELLLQNIQVRRDAGLLATTRRLGPEISKKMYHFYNSDNPDLEL